MSILSDAASLAALPTFLPVDLSMLMWARWPLVGVLALLLAYWVHRRSRTTYVQLFGEALIVVPAYFAYFLVRGFAEAHEAEAFRRALRIIEFEQAANIFWEPSLQAHIYRFDLLVSVVNWVYVWGHWPVIVMAAVWLFFLHRESYSVYRNAFLISGAIGLIIFAAFPVAPPRFLEAWGFVDTVAERSSAYRLLQPPAFVNQYAAMPSLHFGWNLLVGIAIVRHASGYLAKMIGIAVPLAMFASIVFTANHYIIDGLAGGLLALFGLVAALLLHNFLERRTGRSQVLPVGGSGLAGSA